LGTQAETVLLVQAASLACGQSCPLAHGGVVGQLCSVFVTQTMPSAQSPSLVHDSATHVSTVPLQSGGVQFGSSGAHAMSGHATGAALHS
jgi:hypothetical protein